MKNTPNSSPNSLNPYQRLAILAVLGIATSSYPANEADAGGLLPYCGGKAKPAEGPFIDDGDKAQVQCVVDGDTIDVRLGKKHNSKTMRVRIQGIDCPETAHSKKKTKNGGPRTADEIREGNNAKREIRQMLGEGRITLQGPFHNDKYGRKLAYVHLPNGIDVGRALISKCLCEEKYSHKRKANYKKAGKRCKN
ncbi:thermonuclease family protein [Candidatus Peregrinibacteria bacterium]|nr:thermonuclease family protein [Candidatus Peregrinibacteria bacterium]